METKKKSADKLRGKIVFTAYMQEKIDRLEESGKKNTAHNYRSAQHSFLEFLDGRVVLIGELDGEQMIAYEKWMSDKRLRENSSSCYLRQLRAVWHDAVKEGLAELWKDPFRDVFTGMKPTVKRAVPAGSINLLEEEVTRLPKKLEFALSMFLFSYYTRGMSFVDLAHLKKKDIQGGVLTYIRRKTGKVLHIELLPEMIMIIKRYASEVKDSSYLFPLLSKDGEGYESALRLQNKRLKRIATVLGLNVKLTTHVARHSWATIARDRGVDIETICEALGHSSILVTRIYLAELNSSVINEANKIVLKRKQGQKIKLYESAR